MEEEEKEILSSLGIEATQEDEEQDMPVFDENLD